MLQKIVDIIKECGFIVKSAQINSVRFKDQDRRNLLTEYDLKVQAILHKKLKAILPEASFLGEEGNFDYDKSGFCFVCDPIDGTTNFVKEYNFSSISIALLKDGKPIIGVVHNPYLDETFTAEKGSGAKCNGKPIFTSQETLANSLVSFGTGVADIKNIDKVFNYAKKCFDASIDVRRSGSAALDLCNIACGRTGYFFELRLASWDYSAGALIVEEAGGIIKSDNFENVDDYFSAREIFAVANNDILKNVPKF